MALQYWQSHNLPTIRARIFNHLGPGQAPEFAASAFARQLAEIEIGWQEPIVRVGNLDAQRDSTDVRDVVIAYWLLLTKGVPGMVYNVGCGVARPVRELLDTLITLSDMPVEVQIDPNRLRPSDVPVSVCDNRRLVDITDWQLRYSLQDTLRDLLNA